MVRRRFTWARDPRPYSSPAATPYRWGVKVLGISLVAVLLAACAGQRAATGPQESPSSAASPTVRLLFAGDVMVGRGVAPVLATEGASLFEDVRFVVSSADLASANLESGLADDPESVAVEGVGLVGAASAAPTLAGAGFDVLSVANNHAGDAGDGAVAATASALEESGIAPVGLAEDGVPPAPVVEVAHGVRVAYLAFDLTRQGPAPTPEDAGVATWDPEVAAAAVRQARSLADIVAVSLHGGVEYLPGPDPALRRASTLVADAGADVVWAHGSHVVYDVEARDAGDGRVSVVAYGLGNFLFDQHRRGTTEGAIVEVLAGEGGVVGYRVGGVEHPEVWPRFTGWQQPTGDAALLDGEWWQLTGPVAVADAAAPAEDVAERHGDDVEAVAAGDVTADGRLEVVVAFRRPYEQRPVQERFPDAIWTDEQGRTAHLGVYRPEDLGPIWVASGLAHPIAEVVVCDGALAVGYGTLNPGDPVLSGAWTWRIHGFAVAPDLPGPATPACADVDGDGYLDPVLLGRSRAESLSSGAGAHDP
jgi:poly-gamma-glutamate capsule biosynthesis protein CapA/YwtB (metallophosphatase superfamily)